MVEYTGRGAAGVVVSVVVDLDVGNVYVALAVCFGSMPAKKEAWTGAGGAGARLSWLGVRGGVGAAGAVLFALETEERRDSGRRRSVSGGVGRERTLALLLHAASVASDALETSVTDLVSSVLVADSLTGMSSDVGSGATGGGDGATGRV